MPRILSSHGTIDINEDGTVRSSDLEPSWDQPVPARFDVERYRQENAGQLHDSIDICDIGYLMPSGWYEPPVCATQLR